MTKAEYLRQPLELGSTSLSVKDSASRKHGTVTSEWSLVRQLPRLIFTSDCSR